MIFRWLLTCLCCLCGGGTGRRSASNGGGELAWLFLAGRDVGFGPGGSAWTVALLWFDREHGGKQG